MLLERMHTKPGTAASRAPSAHPGQWNAKSERKARGKREGGTHGRGAIPCYGIGMELLVNSLLTSDGAAFGDGDSLMAVGGLSFIGLSDLPKPAFLFFLSSFNGSNPVAPIGSGPKIWSGPGGPNGTILTGAGTSFCAPETYRFSTLFASSASARALDPTVPT